jgi:hypothetical protein
VVVLVAIMATVALADERLDGKLRFGDTVTVPSSETVDHDLYIAGGTIAVDGTVNGDLVVAGGTVTIGGNVDGDVLVAGGTVTLGGSTTGDARLAGGQLTVTGNVGEDLAATGGNVTVNGKVGQDLILGAGNASVSGSVTGSIAGSAGTYSRTGTLGGSEDVEIGRNQPAPQAASNGVLDAIRQFVVVVLFGLLALWLLPRTFHAAENAIRTRPLQSLGGGVLAIIGYIALVIGIILAMVLLAIVLAIATLGALVAVDIIAGILAILLVTFAFIVVFAFVADALVGLAIGRWALPAMGMRMPQDRWSELGVLALGAAVVVILSAIPVLGGFVKLVVVLLGLGALLLVLWGAWRGRGATPAAPVIASTEPPAAPPEPPGAPAGA